MDKNATAETLPPPPDESGHRVRWSGLSLIFDERTLNAILWQLNVVGEATTHLTNELKDSNSHVQWQSASAARNRLVHGYFDIDPNIIWDIVDNDLPFLKLQVENIIEEIKKRDEDDKA